MKWGVKAVWCDLARLCRQGAAAPLSCTAAFGRAGAALWAGGRLETGVGLSEPHSDQVKLLFKSAQPTFEVISASDKTRKVGNPGATVISACENGNDGPREESLGLWFTRQEKGPRWTRQESRDSSARITD